MATAADSLALAAQARRSYVERLLSGVPSVVFITVKLAAVIVAGFMSSLKVAVMLELLGTPAAPAASTVSTTVGRVVSASAAVVKVHTKLLASAKPAAFCAAVVTVAVHSVLAGSAELGVNVAVWVAAS